MLWTVIEFTLFVLSTGLFFREGFRKNSFAVVVAGLIAVGSSYFLFETIVERVKGLTASAVTNPPIPPGSGLAADDLFWLSIKDAAVPALFEEFLERFPASSHVVQARTQLEQLKRSQAERTKRAEEARNAAIQDEARRKQQDEARKQMRINRMQQTMAFILNGDSRSQRVHVVDVENCVATYNAGTYAAGGYSGEDTVFFNNVKKGDIRVTPHRGLYFVALTGGAIVMSKTPDGKIDTLDGVWIPLDHSVTPNTPAGAQQYMDQLNYLYKNLCTGK